MFSSDGDLVCFPPHPWGPKMRMVSSNGDLVCSLLSSTFMRSKYKVRKCFHLMVISCVVCIAPSLVPSE